MRSEPGKLAGLIGPQHRSEERQKVALSCERHRVFSLQETWGTSHEEFSVKRNGFLPEQTFLFLFARIR